MEILEAYDLTGSLCATAELTARSHHTVIRHVWIGSNATILDGVHTRKPRRDRCRRLA